MTKKEQYKLIFRKVPRDEWTPFQCDVMPAFANTDTVSYTRQCLASFLEGLSGNKIHAQGNLNSIIRAINNSTTGHDGELGMWEDDPCVYLTKTHVQFGFDYNDPDNIHGPINDVKELLEEWIDFINK